MININVLDIKEIVMRNIHILSDSKSFVLNIFIKTENGEMCQLSLFADDKKNLIPTMEEDDE